MPLTCWNTAKTLFWIIQRQSPTDRLLDQDDELALATVLLSAQPSRQPSVLVTKSRFDFEAVKAPLVQPIAQAADELSAALRATQIVCLNAQGTELTSSVEGFYIKGPTGNTFRLKFPFGMVKRQWPSANGARRCFMNGYDADEFFAEAMALLKRKRGIRSGFSESTFKARMLDWSVDTWGIEPNAAWVRQHLALAREAFENAGHYFQKPDLPRARRLGRGGHGSWSRVRGSLS
jgi:hypothetical protein